MTQTLRPVRNTVFAKPLADPTQTDSGLQIVQHAKLPRATIVAIGPEVSDLQLVEGDVIVYKAWQELFLNITDRFHVIDFNDIYGVVRDVE